jgi:RNA polymerase sigma-70 factor (ECF subfamily)
MHQELTISIASIAVMKDDRSDGISESFPSENPSVSVREEWTGALIARARAGESEAFESLMRQYERRVLTIASRLLSSRDEARDVEQEVFLRLHRYLHRFEDGRAFAPWLYRLTVNVCHDLNRRRKWSQTISLESEQERGRLDHLTDLRTPEEILVAKQQQRMAAAHGCRRACHVARKGTRCCCVARCSGIGNQGSRRDSAIQRSHCPQSDQHGSHQIEKIS